MLTLKPHPQERDWRTGRPYACPRAEEYASAVEHALALADLEWRDDDMAAVLRDLIAYLRNGTTKAD